MGIRWKWLTAHLVIGGLALVFIVLYLSSQLKDYFEARFENRWRRELALARDYLESSDIQSWRDAQFDDWANRRGETLGMRVTVIDAKGLVRGDSEVELSRLREVENHGNRPEIRQALTEGFGKSRRRSSTVDVDLFYLAMPLQKEANHGSVIRVAVPTKEIDESISQMHGLIWLATGVGFMLVVITGFFASKSMAGQMDEMVEAAKRFARGDLSHKIPIQSTPELAELSQTLNQMSDDLQHSMSEITQERDQLQAILNSMVEGVMVTDRDSRIALINRSFEKIFLVSDSVINKATKSVFRDAQLLEALEKANRERKDSIVTLELLTPNRKTLEAHIAILGLGRGPSGVVVVFHDITRLQHLEQVRRDFVANVSHELRTPLTAIKGYVETLVDDGKMEEAQRKTFLQTVLRHSDRMAKLVDDLLSLSKLESIEPDALKTINISEACLRLVESFSKVSEKENLRIEIEVPETPVLATGIPSEIESAFSNLIDNAIKYGADGDAIWVKVEEHENDIQVSVRDEGIGIPVDDQQRVFERFYRVDKGRSRELGGTGLGLSIVKHIILRHNGRLWVESKIGEGSTFYFTLPKSRVAAPA